MLKSFFTVGFFTLISRILGYVREVLMARAMGASTLTDIFAIAFRLPNFFRQLSAEGAFSAAFVPMFSGKLSAEGMEKAKEFAESVLSIMVVALIIFTAFMEIIMPGVLYVLAPGFAKDPETFDLAVYLTRVTFPYLIFISLVSLYGGILNSHEKFGAFAAAPIFLNLCMILALLVGKNYTETPAHALSYAVAVAGIVQWLWMVIFSYRYGILLRFKRPRLTPELRTMFRRMVPGALATGVTQIILLIDTAVASLIPSAISFLYYANRLNQLPLTIIGTAVGIILLPMLSKQLRLGKKREAIETQNRLVEISLLFSLPAAAAIVLLAHPIISVLFERGAFTASDSVATAYALMAYILGLPAYVLIKVFTPVFFASGDTKTPVKYAVLCIGVYLVFLALFMAVFDAMGWMLHPAIALATASSSCVNVFLLVRGLRQRGLTAMDSTLIMRAKKIIVATFAMCACLLGLNEMLITFMQSGRSELAMGLFAQIGIGMALYGAIILLSGAYKISEIKAYLKR